MTNSSTADQEFLEYLVKSLVDHPEDVKVDRKVDEMEEPEGGRGPRPERPMEESGQEAS